MEYIHLSRYLLMLFCFFFVTIHYSKWVLKVAVKRKCWMVLTLHINKIQTILLCLIAGYSQTVSQHFCKWLEYTLYLNISRQKAKMEIMEWEGNWTIQICLWKAHKSGHLIWHQIKLLFMMCSYKKESCSLLESAATVVQAKGNGFSVEKK